MSGAAPLLRSANRGDIAEIRAIEANPEYRECVGTWSEEEYLRVIESESAAVTVADCEGHIAGFYVLRSIGAKDRSVELMRVAVAEPGRGVGLMLLQHAMREAFDRHGAHRLWLDVFTTNLRAQRLYSELGFVHEGTLRDSKFRDGRFQSQHLMSMLEDEYRRRYGASVSRVPQSLNVGE